LPGELLNIFLGGKVLAFFSHVAGQKGPAKQTHYKGKNAVEGYDKEMFHVRQFLIVSHWPKASHWLLKVLPSRLPQRYQFGVGMEGSFYRRFSRLAIAGAYLENEDVRRSASDSRCT
jgi:hypothetical protein